MEAGDIALLGEHFAYIHQPWVQYSEQHRLGTIFFTYARIWNQEDLKFKGILSVVSLRPSGCMKSWKGESFK